MALLKKPQNIVDANIWINSTNYLGVTTSLKSPKIATGRNDQKVAGFTRKLSTGIFEPLEGEFEISEYSPAVMAMLSNTQDGQDVEILIKASIYSGGTRVPLVAKWKGLVEVEDGELKAGENVSRKVKLDLYYAQLTIDGYEEYRLDINNLVGVVDGNDLNDTLRKHIM